MAKSLHTYEFFGYDQRIKRTVLMISYTSAMTSPAVSNCENHKMSEQNFLLQVSCIKGWKHFFI